MHKIKLLISYDGSEYQGWQRQPTAPSVQATLETALSQIYSEPIRIFGSGRTDAGTHAVGQVAHYLPSKIMAKEERLVRALNSLLPDSVVVKGAWRAPEDFHALHSTVRKTYIYRIWNDPVRSALWSKRALWVPQPLNLEKLNELSRVIVGERDFKSFQSAGTPVSTTTRRVEICEWQRLKPRGSLLELKITGNGFLKQMVRNLVGTLLHLERNGGSVRDLRGIFDALDRQAAKATAAAHGLYLYRVEYPRVLDKKCRKI